MKNVNNRRHWLKQVALASAGLGVGSSAWASSSNRYSQAKTAYRHFWEWETTLAPNRLPELKARLLANENPYGPSDLARAAISDNIIKGNRYGHGQAAQLIEMLAEKEGVPKEYIMLGPGSSDLLEKIAIALFMEGGNIVTAEPTYMSLIKTAESFQAERKALPLLDNWEYDLKGMGAAIDGDTKLVYICNPNNPSGTITNGERLWEFCKTYSDQTPIFVDEAYLEFMYEDDRKSMVRLLDEEKNVIVCRTFSKAYGMAGIRVGYIVALPSTLEKVQKIFRGNMGLNVTALEAAIASLSSDEFVKYSVKNNTACRDFVCAELKKLDIPYLPSQTSFVLFPIQMEGKPFLDKMFEQKIGVRSFEIFDQTYCRVSIGTMDEMKMFVDAFHKVMA